MYASAMTPYNAANMGPHRDVVGELAAATRARGLRFGVSSHTAEHWWWYGADSAIASDVRDRTPETALLYGPAEPMALSGPGGVSDPTKEPDPNRLELWLPPDRRFLEGWLAGASELVDRYHPDFVISTGGSVSLPSNRTSSSLPHTSMIVPLNGTSSPS